jgi:acyl-CoA dehydrogenase
VNARLVRDSFLGSIWEGAENVVALDVARAASKERAHDALFRDLEERLDGLRDVDVVREAAKLKQSLAEARERFERLLRAEAAERESRMTYMCDRLAAVACCTLLLQEADAQVRSGGGYRKLLVATEYRRRNVERMDPLDYSSAGVKWLDEVVDWRPVPAEAVTS